MKTTWNLQHTKESKELNIIVKSHYAITFLLIHPFTYLNHEGFLVSQHKEDAQKIFVILKQQCILQRYLRLWDL